MIKRTLYFGNPSYLSKHLEQLVIQLPASNSSPQQHSIPIEDVGIVVLDHPQISLTQGLIQSLIENNVAIVHCNQKHHPIGLVLPLDSNDVQSQRFQQQLEASEPLRKQLWQQTVQAKIKNQAYLLEMQGKPHQTLLTLASRVRSGDPDNLEAQAAVYYWQRLFPEHLHFRRHREGDYPNNLLNYGYAILRATVARALVASGLLPTLGIHHSNKYNAYCLADDIMEPFRPFVDRLVCQLVETHQGNELDKDTKQKMLTIPTLDVGIRNERSPLLNATHRTAASLYKCLAGEQRRILYPEWISKIKTDKAQQQLDFQDED